MAPCRILVVDDSEDMLFLVRVLIDTGDDAIEIVGTARNDVEAYAMYLEHEPDLLVLDNVLPGSSGLDIAKEILEADPTATIVLFSEFLDAAILKQADRIGVRACLSKDHFQRLPDLLLELCPG
jgi:DNA-binding NarL/FixJ family response regulator